MKKYHAPGPNAETRAQIEFMLKNPGLYACGDQRQPDAVIPVVSHNGRLFSMKPDQALSPDGFLDTLTVEGPYPLRLRTPPPQ